MKLANNKELGVPPLAADAMAREALRVWTKEGDGNQFVVQPMWDDPTCWGLLLVDIARHVAKAYAALHGRSEEQSLQQIYKGFQMEWNHPTDKPRRIA